MGRHPGVEAGPGIMDTNRDRTAYQCSRFESSVVCSEDLHQRPEKLSCSHEDRQQDCCGLHSENGGYSFGTHVACHTRDMESCSGKGDNPVCRVFARVPEYIGRLAVEEFQRQQRLAVKEVCVPAAEQSMGAFQAGSVRKSPQHTARTLCQLVSGSVCSGDGCFPAVVKGGGNVSVPTICHDSTVFNENSTGEGISSSDSTPVADPAVVPKSAVSVVRQPDSSSPIQRPVITDPADPSASTPKSVPSCGLENLRGRDLDEGVSEQAANLMAEHMWRKGTATAYNSSWRQWCSWCNGKQMDPFRTPLLDIVNYLSERFDKGDSYRTLNSRRSAISAFHEQVNGFKTGQHPLVKRFLTATFNARPPQPRYKVQWDVNVVLNYIKSIGSNDMLTDKLLTLKLAMLLALVSAGRTSELGAFNIRYMTDSEDSISFKLAKLTKSRKTGQPPLLLAFTVFFSGTSTLCCSDYQELSD